MRKNELLTIDVARRDLLPQPEYWAEESYEERYAKLLAIIKRKTSFMPRGNTKVIREISFNIMPSTTLGDIRGVCRQFEAIYGISCFQASIDRKAQVAHLLVAWVDKKTGKAVPLFENTLKRFTGMLIRRLHLPQPKNYEDWVRYTLLDAYEENHDVFKQQWRWFRQETNLQSDSHIIRDALIYAELMSKGTVR